MKDEFKCSNISFMHNQYCMAHCIKYMFSCLKQEYRVKKGLALDKSFRKIFGEKEENSNRSEFLKNLKSQPGWHQSCKSNQLDMRDKVKSATKLAIKGKSK